MHVAQVARILDLSAPWSYAGNAEKCGIRDGTGSENWKNDHSQCYKGLYQNDRIHGHGTYNWKHLCYEGKLYANDLHGYGLMSYQDGSFYEGLFKNNHRFGPGVVTYSNNTQDVGLWVGNHLLRLSSTVTSHCVPQLATTIEAKNYLLKNKKIIEILKPKIKSYKTIKELGTNYLQQSSRFIRTSKNEFFKVINFDKKYFCDQKIDNNKSFINSTSDQENSYLLAWNNDEELISMREYSFRHHSFEHNMSYKVEHVISGHRNSFKSPGKLEVACEKLFNSCCDGENNTSCLIITFDLNPDVCDAAGNSPVHCVASCNNIKSLHALVNLGANLDKLNDECLTPLVISLLQYLAVKENVTDWQKAFLPSILSDNPSPQLYILDLKCKVVQLKPKNKKIRGKPFIKRKKNEKTKKKHVELKHSNIDSVKIHVELEQKSMAEKLFMINKTIMALFYYGASANKGGVPLPPLILSLFTKDENIIKSLIKCGADCNLTTSYQDGTLTPLHVVTAMKSSLELPNIAQLLLESGANPNCRANTYHYIDEKLLLDPDKIYEDEGKTPLHLLSMRYDYEEDECDYLGQLYDTLVKLGCDPNVTYLGHTCLSLAVIRGNLKLIDHILRTHIINPNQFLGCRMGIPLTVLILKKYKNVLPLYACQDVYDLLIKYGANPFTIAADSVGNAIEYCYEENRPETMVNISKKDTHYKIQQYLYHTAENILDRFITAKAIKCIYNYKFLFSFSGTIFDAMVKFLDISKTKRILQLLIDCDSIFFVSEEMNAFLEYVEEKTTRKKKTKSRVLKDKLTTNFHAFVQELKMKKSIQQKTYAPVPEVDTSEDKYKVCYNCYKKLHKTLVLCPNCELVSFCSQECNKINIKKKNNHKCKDIFYFEELKKMSQQQYGATTLDLMKRKSGDFLSDPHSNFNVKYSFMNPATHDKLTSLIKGEKSLYIFSENEKYFKKVQEGKRKSNVSIQMPGRHKVFLEKK